MLEGKRTLCWNNFGNNIYIYVYMMQKELDNAGIIATHIHNNIYTLFTKNALCKFIEPQILLYINKS